MCYLHYCLNEITLVWSLALTSFKFQGPLKNPKVCTKKNNNKRLFRRNKFSLFIPRTLLFFAWNNEIEQRKN